jgi:micrococcal nuclease
MPGSPRARSSLFGGLLAIVAVLGLATGCTQPAETSAGTTQPDPTTAPAGTAVVDRVVDGDTLVLDFGRGRIERVRLIGIDTPETSHPTRPVECFGAEAAEHLRALLPPGTLVRTERDREARDHYDRLLLYLYRVDDDLFVNEAMVAGGYATSLYVEPNGAHRQTFVDAEASARAAGLGMWTVCGGPGVPLDPLTTTAG